MTDRDTTLNGGGLEAIRGIVTSSTATVRLRQGSACMTIRPQPANNRRSCIRFRQFDQITDLPLLHFTSQLESASGQREVTIDVM